MEILRCEGISKIYGSGDTQIKALDNVSFSVEKGEFVSIIGPSGSGKSTLLHILGGVDKPTEGKVYIDGTDIHSLNEDKLAIFRRRQIGLVYQFYNLMPVLNIDENIALPHLLDGRALDKERLDSVVEHLGLTDRRGNLPNQLSGGQQQRVSIARAMALGPDVIMFDEPTSALDPQLTREVLDTIKRLKDDGITMIIVTHELEFARKVSDRTVFMYGGLVVEEADSESFFTSPKDARTKDFIRGDR
jgi:putative ABC transport system ATP-binding protein